MSAVSPLPLAGKRIVVTRARSQASSLVRALTELGAEVLELPTIEIVPLASYEVLDEALRKIASYQWLIVTSANTVRVLSERLEALGLPISSMAGVRVAAVGSATAQALRERGFEVSVVPKQYVAESLVDALGDDVGGSRILLGRASVARDVIPDALRRRGAVVDVVDAYRTETPSGAGDRVREVFSDTTRLPDAVTFTSSSTVNNFMILWEGASLGERPAALRAISIGPITSEALQENGWEPAAQATNHTVTGLVDVLCRYFSCGE